MGCGKLSQCIVHCLTKVTITRYVNQLVCAVGGVSDFTAKSESKKEEEKVEFDMPMYNNNKKVLITIIVMFIPINSSLLSSFEICSLIH